MWQTMSDHCQKTRRNKAFGELRGSSPCILPQRRNQRRNILRSRLQTANKASSLQFPWDWTNLFIDLFVLFLCVWELAVYSQKMGSPNPGWSLQSALSLQNYMLPSLCTNWKINHWEWDYFARDTGLSQTGDSYQSTKVWGNKQSDCQGGYDYLTGSSILKKCYHLTNSSKNNWDLRDQLRSTQISAKNSRAENTTLCLGPWDEGSNI